MNSPFRLLACSEAEADLYAWRRAREAGLVVRIIRGRRCAVLDRCMAEFAAAMQFPYCFEPNWSSFAASLSDLQFSPGARLLLILTHVGRILPRASADFARLIEILHNFAQGCDPARLSDVEIILHGDPVEIPTIEKRTLAAGAHIRPIEE